MSDEPNTPSNGSAYVFLLPYEIHTAAAFHISTEREFSGLHVRVYPPFKNGDGLRLHRPLHLQSLPHLPATVHPSKLLPELDAAGNPAWAIPHVLADALRLDIYGREDTHVAIADAIGQRFLRLLRMVTRQWWIMRGASESLAPLQNHFPIDAQGQPLGTLNQMQRIIPWLGSELLVTHETLGIACDYLLSRKHRYPGILFDPARFSLRMAA